MAKKTGLGKGLGALIKETEVDFQTEAPVEIALSKIKPNPNQPRKQFDKRKLDELSASIKQHGVLQPILLRPKGAQYEIVAGERRYTAAKQAGLKKIPALIKDVSEEKVLTLALIENVQRDDLNPVEEALSYQELLEERGFTQTSLAKELSKSRSAIANTLRLLDLPEGVLKLLKNEEISAGHARALLSLSTAEEQLALAKKTIAKKLSVRELENIVAFSRAAKSGTKKAAQPRPKSFSEATSELKKMLGRSVRISSRKGSLKLEIPFSDEKDLQKVVKKIKQGA